VGARFSTLDGLLPKLYGRRNFTLRTHAVAYEVPVDNDGRPRGVAFVDARTRRTSGVDARAVVLAASTVESGRLLLNSRSRHHPAGLANSSGLVGRHLMDTIKSGPVAGIVPHWRNRPRASEDGAGGTHVTIPRFNYDRKTDYRGGYFILLGSGFGRGATTAGLAGVGTAFKAAVRERYGAVLSLRGYGECQSHAENRFEIDPQRKDGFGIPQVRFVCGHGDNELRMMEDMYGWMDAILRAMDAEVLPYRKRLEPLGDATHECGTARMGHDPATSVLNPWCQAHDVRNLFVTDASGFVSMPGTHGITTLIMALAWRASDYLAEQFRTGAMA
jgi:choline dehydrogenase-like flavoprotein